MQELLELVLEMVESEDPRRIRISVHIVRATLQFTHGEPRRKFCNHRLMTRYMSEAWKHRHVWLTD